MKVKKLWHVLNDLINGSDKNPTNISCRFGGPTGEYITEAEIINGNDLILYSNDEFEMSWQHRESGKRYCYHICDAYNLLHVVTSLCRGSHKVSGNGEVLVHRHGRPGIVFVCMASNDKNALWFETTDDDSLVKGEFDARLEFIHAIERLFYRDLYNTGFYTETMRKCITDDFESTRFNRSTNSYPSKRRITPDEIRMFVDTLIRHTEHPYPDDAMNVGLAEHNKLMDKEMPD